MGKRIDICEFPRLDGGDLNWIEYYKYWAIVEDLDEKAESEFNAHLRKVFRDKYCVGRNANAKTC